MPASTVIMDIAQVGLFWMRSTIYGLCFPSIFWNGRNGRWPGPVAPARYNLPRCRERRKDNAPAPVAAGRRQ